MCTFWKKPKQQGGARRYKVRRTWRRVPPMVTCTAGAHRPDGRWDVDKRELTEKGEPKLGRKPLEWAKQVSPRAPTPVSGNSPTLLSLPNLLCDPEQATCTLCLFPSFAKQRWQHHLPPKIRRSKRPVLQTVHDTGQAITSVFAFFPLSLPNILSNEPAQRCGIKGSLHLYRLSLRVGWRSYNPR